MKNIPQFHPQALFPVPLPELEVIVKGWMREVIAETPGLATSSTDESENGDFSWLCSLLPTVPKSTLRQKIAAGQVPGVSKIGKRLVFNKARVRQWLQDSQKPTSSDLTSKAEVAFTERVTKRKSR